MSVRSHDVPRGEGKRADAGRWIRRHPVKTALAIVLAALVVLILLWDWNWLKRPIQSQVQLRTGREFVIGGDLDVDLGRITTVRAQQLRFGNAGWSREPTMASADAVELQIEAWPLLRGDVRLPSIRLLRPHALLEIHPKTGEGNWVFERRGGRSPTFDSVWIDDGDLRFLDARQRTDIRVDLASRAPGAGESAPAVAAKGGGRWRGNAFTVNGGAESPLQLRDRERPYRLDLRATAGNTRAHARGTMTDPLHLTDMDLRMALSGQDLADLYPLMGIAIPHTPPYSLDGRLTRDGNTWHYDGFTGRVGDSDLSGSASIDAGGERPYFRANLISKRLDLDDLAGFVGGAPQRGAGETTNAQLAAQSAQAQARPRVLPSTPYELEKLRAMDADVRLRAQRIDAPKLPLDDMDAHLKLERGLLRLDPLDFGVADGDVRSTITMDARSSTIRTRADITAHRLDLARLLPDVKLADDAIGKVGGHVALAGTGNSIAAMLGSSNGDIALGMGRGQISNLLMEFAGIDIAEIAKFKLAGDRKVPIRCAFGDFAVRDGVMTARSLAFDTTDTILIGSGTISLKDETFDLVIRPRPKDRSLLSLRTPLTVTGTFKQPSFKPNTALLGLRGALAIALGTITPPAALLATLELGPGEDASCGGRYAK